MAVSFCKQFLMEEIPFRFETLQYENTYSQDLLSVSNVSYLESEQNFKWTVLKREEYYSTIHYIIMSSTLFDYTIGTSKTTEDLSHF